VWEKIEGGVKRREGGSEKKTGERGREGERREKERENEREGELEKEREEGASLRDAHVAEARPEGPGSTCRARPNLDGEPVGSGREKHQNRAIGNRDVETWYENEDK
jgi:hypothetical protein